MTDLDFTGMGIAERDAYRVGELMAPLLNPDWHTGGSWHNAEYSIAYYRPNVATADLMKLAHVGKSMLYDAVYVADEQDNVEFFEEAFSLYGHLITVALEEMSLPDRCSLCGVLLPHTEDCKHRRTENQ